ncbi:MAG TPA: tetratricopeptide repeat protein [Thermoanaerobaculia bacterium]|nr:tetratricopeptide repeat protein [Thermoanaerobaculia bacterium]
MQRLLILPVAALLILPALGCGKVQARADLKKGNSYYQQEQYSKALDAYQKGLELDPDATFAWRSVGLSALALYRPGDESPRNVEYATTAIDAFEKYLADYPDDEKIPEYLMSTYVNAKKFDEAIAFIDRRIQEKPEQAANLQRAKVTILTQSGRLDKAFELANQLQGQERAQALYSIGVSAWDKVFHDPGTLDYESRGRLVDMGMDAIKKALEIKPDYAEAMVYYGLLYRQKASLEIDPAKRVEDVQIAEEWLRKYNELRKKAQAQAPANT